MANIPRQLSHYTTKDSIPLNSGFFYQLLTMKKYPFYLTILNSLFLMDCKSFVYNPSILLLVKQLILPERQYLTICNKNTASFLRFRNHASTQVVWYMKKIFNVLTSQRLPRHIRGLNHNKTQQSNIVSSTRQIKIIDKRVKTQQIWPPL